MQFNDVAAQYRTYQAEIDQALGMVLESGAYVLGPAVATVEERLAAWCQRRHCITVGSGTDALLMSLMALDIGPGDEVITTPFTWISTAEVIELVHAQTVFVDIDAASFNLDLAAVEAAITPRTKAVIPVSLFGQMPDYAALHGLCAARGIAVIEDGAQSFGATRAGLPSCGVPGTIGCTSFFPTKPLSCFGEGGALFTDDDALAERFRLIRTHGSLGRGGHSLVGLNGRMETVQCAVLGVKLDHFADELAARRAAAARYETLLAGLPGLITPPVAVDTGHAYGVYTIRVPARDRVRAALQDQGVPTAVYYQRGLHEEPVFAHLGLDAGAFPGVERACAEVLSLPMHAFITAAEQEAVAAALRAALCSGQGA